jgi:hypothetical protein
MKVLATTAAALLAVASSAAGGQQSIPFEGERLARVMTRNVDHGVIRQIRDVATATNLPDLLGKVSAVYDGYFQSNFPARATALAAEIDAIRPELIGVQEAILVRTQFPADGARTPAQTISLDYVEILLDALARRGLAYEIAVQKDGFDVEFPSAAGFDVRHTDREVILARSDLATSDLKLWNAQSGNFAANCQIPTALLGPITIRRSWVSVDAMIRGVPFRLVSTHLDGDCLPFTGFQRAQAAELLAGPAATDLPLLLIGDLNSPAANTGGTYNDLLRAGFSDAWSITGSPGTGLTCCQEDLWSPMSTLDRRIDFVLLRGGLHALAAVVTGDQPTQEVAIVWPSDHAGVAAVIRLSR